MNAQWSIDHALKNTIKQNLWLTPLFVQKLNFISLLHQFSETVNCQQDKPGIY
jgi:hypothetical protein